MARKKAKKNRPNPRGRPVKRDSLRQAGIPFQIRMPVDLHARAIEKSKAARISLGEIIRDLLTRWLDEKK